jgi:hypothetical protein
MRFAARLPLVLLLSPVVLLAGCAADNQKPTLARAVPAQLPGITNHYEQATAHPRRAVRKPIRDQQAYALRELARSTDTLLGQTKDWDSDTRLVALNDTQRKARDEAVDSFRSSLQGLKAAAEKSDIGALQAQYSRAIASYRQVNELVPSTE